MSAPGTRTFALRSDYAICSPGPHASDSGKITPPVPGSPAGGWKSVRILASIIARANSYNKSPLTSLSIYILLLLFLQRTLTMLGLTVEGHNGIGGGVMEVFHILIMTMAQGCIHWSTLMDLNT